MSQKSPAEMLEIFGSLSPEQQKVVEVFIDYMREKNPASLDVRFALDEFIRDHPELLRHLA